MSEVKAKRGRPHKREVGIKTADKIIREAEAIIATQGLNSVRLHAISEATGIQLPSIYSHYKGRDEILAKIVASAIEGLGDQFPESEGFTPEEAVRRGASGLVLHMAAHPAHARILLVDFAEPNGLPEFTATAGPPGSVEEGGNLAEVLIRLEKLIARGVDAGIFRPYDAKKFFRTILCFAATGVAFVYRTNVARSKTSLMIVDLQQEMEEIAIRILRV